MLKNQLRLIVLKKLEDKNLSGYDLIKEIYRSTGSWKPSFGSMYPLLKELHANKLVTFKVLKRKKIYSITAFGKKTLKEALAASQNTIENMAKEFKMMENICSVHEKKHLEAVIKKIHQDKSIFKGFTDEMDRFQSTMIRILTDAKFRSKESEIKKILNNTIQKLNDLGRG
ncbi:MAG: PadR family transcriptional regulator [Candidatus Woesearchaeota archaeon]